MAILFCLSGHGFGHAARLTEVINALYRLAPDREIILRAAVAEWFLREEIACPFTLLAGPLDTGLVQHSSLEIDHERTLEAVEAFYADPAALVAGERERLAGRRVELVVADIPPLAFPLARALGAKSIALGNFSWSWIYGHYAKREPRFAPAAAAVAAMEGQADLLLRLPFHGAMDSFPAVEDVPLVGRASDREPAETRRRLGLETDRPLALLSFGGFAMRFAGASGPAPRARFIAGSEVRTDDGRITAFSRERLKEAGVRYRDLVRAADAVVTKPGYGIVAECIANRTRMIYTDRGDFPEYPILVAAAERHLGARHVPAAELNLARLDAEVAALAGDGFRFPDCPRAGQETIAARLLSLLPG